MGWNGRRRYSALREIWCTACGEKRTGNVCDRCEATQRENALWERAEGPAPDHTGRGEEYRHVKTLARASVDGSYTETKYIAAHGEGFYVRECSWLGWSRHYVAVRKGA